MDGYTDFDWRKTCAMNNVIAHVTLFVSLVAHQPPNISACLAKLVQHSNHALCKLCTMTETQTTSIAMRQLLHILLYI